MDTRLIARYANREILEIVGMSVALFWSVGRITGVLSGDRSQ